jgi:hypothetical protein
MNNTNATPNRALSIAAKQLLENGPHVQEAVGQGHKQ